MELKQQLKMSQQLVMTPQLQQAIKLLQMSRMELVDVIHEELLENPILEDSQEEQPSAASNARAEGDGEARETTAQPTGEQPREPGPANEVRETDKKAEEFDWERYIENHTLQQPMPSVRHGDTDELPSYEATLANSEGLAEHLEWQLRLSDFVEDERRFAALVVGNLDANGYLSLEGVPPEEVVPKLAAEAELDPEDAEEVLKLIQQLDPVGVGSRSLEECLRVQAEHHEMDDLVLQVIDHHLGDLERRSYSAIAKQLGTTLEDVYDIAQVIGELEPRPARNYMTEEPRYITPDVHVYKVGDQYYVSSNDDGMPKLKISGFYRAAMHGDANAREYIQNKMRSAQWLIRSIEQRRKTIERVTECIVEKQRDFLEKGIDHLKPMILRDVAETVGMHESTISRVTSNKYVNTPQGLFELKYFFNSGIRRDNNQDDIASESVKQAIKRIIDSEDPRKPYSDQKIVEMMSSEGIVIARRTVAKYREMLGILSSSKRKKYF